MALLRLAAISNVPLSDPIKPYQITAPFRALLVSSGSFKREDLGEVGKRPNRRPSIRPWVWPVGGGVVHGALWGWVGLARCGFMVTVTSMSSVILSRLPVDAFGVISISEFDSSNGGNDGRTTGQVGVRSGWILQGLGGARPHGRRIPPPSGEVRSPERDRGAGTAARRVAGVQEH